MFDLLHPFRIRLGVGGVEGIHHNDCSFASLCALPHYLAIYEAGFNASPQNHICHEVMVGGELAVAVVSLLCLLVEPAPPSVELALDGCIFCKLYVIRWDG